MGYNGVVLLIEDNEELNTANRRALERLLEATPDIILLDVMLPDGDGFAFCREIREATQAHILFLTAKIEHEDMACNIPLYRLEGRA